MRKYLLFGILCVSVCVAVPWAFLIRAGAPVWWLFALVVGCIANGNLAQWARKRWLLKPWVPPAEIDGDARTAELVRMTAIAYELDADAARAVTTLVHGARLSGKVAQYREINARTGGILS